MQEELRLLHKLHASCVERRDAMKRRFAPALQARPPRAVSLSLSCPSALCLWTMRGRLDCGVWVVDYLLWFFAVVLVCGDVRCGIWVTVRLCDGVLYQLPFLCGLYDVLA